MTFKQIATIHFTGKQAKICESLDCQAKILLKTKFPLFKEFIEQSKCLLEDFNSIDDAVYQDRFRGLRNNADYIRKQEYLNSFMIGNFTGWAAERIKEKGLNTDLVTGIRCLDYINGYGLLTEWPSENLDIISLVRQLTEFKNGEYQAIDDILKSMASLRKLKNKNPKTPPVIIPNYYATPTAPQQGMSVPADGKGKTARKRKQVPDKLKRRLQKEVDSQCPFCGNGEVECFENHHIDGNSANTVFENLIMVCPTCHAKITQGSIPEKDVREKKNTLKKVEELPEAETVK